MKDTAWKSARFRHVAVWVVVAVAAVECPAGRVFGRITLDGRPVANVRVEVECNGEEQVDTTDGNGVYRLHLRREGPCTISVKTADGITGQARVYSYSTSSRQDFELSRTGAMRRK